MAEERKFLLEVAGRGTATVRFVEDGTTEVGRFDVRDAEEVTDVGVRLIVEAETRLVTWHAIVSMASDQTERHIAFLEHVAPDSIAGRLRSQSPTLDAVVEAALRSWVGEHGGLATAARALEAPEVGALREAVLSIIDDRIGDARGLILALGLAGGPRDALALGDAICAIGHTDQHPWRWTYGLEALRLLGTRDAHMQIQRVATQSSNPAAITAARDKLLHIAGDLGVPVWEVQDELVPTCGLDAAGGVELNYGPRRFQLVLDDALKPSLLERPGGWRHSDLPPCEAGDDDVASAQARARWDIVREQIVEAVPVQAHRFEEALAQQTRWSGRQWARVVRRHPLLVHLVSRAVWGTYSKGGRRLIDTFRVAADDHSLWGSDDEPYTLDPECSIGIPHPTEMDQALRDAWGVILADYEVVTMFPQIDRPLYRPSEQRRRETSYPLDIQVPGTWALVLLHRRGWQPYEGWGTRLQKVFRNRDVKAVLDVNVQPTSVDLTAVGFERYLGFPQTTFQLRDVADVAYSETLYELEQLRMPQETGGWPAVVNR